LVLVVVFAGCYGSTEPATNVGPDNATLNARGTANHGPATTYFEYWVSDGSGPTLQTDRSHFPGGASGQFSQKVTGLAETTSYSFRLCGFDDAGGPTVCAQTRTFQTRPVPTEDSVTGGFDLGSTAKATVDAHSGPSGESPHGHIHYQGTIDGWAAFDGDVTCVAVNGQYGAVGAVGQGTPLADPSNPRPATVLATIFDGNGDAPDTVGRVFAEGSTPPDCGTASFNSQFGIGVGDFVVADAPAAGPTSAR
jgi:hypothetical protein